MTLDSRKSPTLKISIWFYNKTVSTSGQCFQLLLLCFFSSAQETEVFAFAHMSFSTRWKRKLAYWGECLHSGKQKQKFNSKHQNDFTAQAVQVLYSVFYDTQPEQKNSIHKKKKMLTVNASIWCVSSQQILVFEGMRGSKNIILEHVIHLSKEQRPLHGTRQINWPGQRVLFSWLSLSAAVIIVRCSC